MAFPGGRRESQDSTLYETAVRETEEEVGLDLESSASFVAPLDDLISPLREGRSSLVIRPQVFVSCEPLRITINDEVERCYWLPLAKLLDPECRGVMPYRWKGNQVELPVIRIEDADIWGLSLRMLDSFFRVALESQP
jgi:8-oxo-dGTP pyrophosphatase MutT (NUDIX family)